jgi:hypothetical protein
VFHETLRIQQLPGIDDPIGSDALPGALEPSGLQRPYHQTLKGRLAPNPEIHALGSSEQLGQALRKHVATISGVGPEHLSCPVRPKPLSTPALLFGVPDPYEQYEVTVLTIRTKHGDGPRFCHAGEIEEITVRPVSAPGRVGLGAQHESRAVQIRQDALAPRGEDLG